MFRKIKKCLTAFIASAVMITCAGCTTGQSTTHVLSVDGYDLKAGVYIYYQYVALEDAKRLALEENEELDTEDQEALEKATIEGAPFLEWLNSKTMSNCNEHIAVIKKFDELQLTLTEKEIEDAEDYVESVYDDPENMYYKNGIGEESFEEVILNTYKASAIFDAIYGEGGSENVQESTLKEHYIENNARVKYVSLDLHDSEGNDLDEAGKKEVMNMANKYLNTVKGASDEKEMLEKFNEAMADYNEYAEAKANGETGDTAAEETTEPAVTTTAEGSDTETTTTTTTTDPYANESIIPALTTDEETKEEDLIYNPSKAFYDWAYNPNTKVGVPEIIEDEDTVYVAVKLDIKERMTEEDLWTESVIENVRFSLYSDALQENLDAWVEELEVKINSEAVDRYDPFNFEVPEES